jgi:hypothetical protein
MMGQTGAGGGDTAKKLFNGYDSIANGMLSQSAVTGDAELGGGRSVVKIRVCESVSELAQALEIDGSLSVSYLKAVNVTAKMSFMKKLNATARSVTIVVYASHETGTWTAKNVKLLPEIELPGDDDQAADFAAAYGDSYVSAATQGGEYYAVYTFHTETQTEQKELTASLKAKGVYSGVTAKLEVQTKLTDFLKRTSTNWTFDQEITGIANPKLPNEDGLIAFALAFPSERIDSPVTTGFKVSGYEGVPRMGRRRLAKIVENREHFLGDDGVLKAYERLTGLQNQIDWLKRIYARYKFTGDTGLLEFEKQVKEDIGKINKQVSAYKRDPAAELPDLKLPSLDKGEPVLTYVVGQTPSFGGEGAGPFDFLSVDEALRNQVRLASIRLFVGDGGSGGLIGKIEIGYASDKSNWVETHGGSGTGRERFDIGDGRFPVRFVVNAGGYVDRFEMHLDDKRLTFAGGTGGTRNEWKPDPGFVVLGFTGRAGMVLDQIKIVHAALRPAEYRQPLR